MNEKILKGLEALKFLNLSSIVDSTALKKEKVAACVLLADQISSLKPNLHSSSELTSRTIEGLINLCDDNDADVRAAADESLNRVLRILSEWGVLSVQRELYAVIKKNGSPRSVRTALLKFAALVGKTNPSKGEAFAANLIPCLIKLAARVEESVVETLGKALEQIWPVLGKFAKSPQTKDILKAFLFNLSSENTVIRRTSAASLVVIVSYSCKPEVFATLVLNCVIEKVVPVDGDVSTHLLQGVLNALRGLLPLLAKQIALSEDSSAYVDKQLQVYELCLHCAVNRDHNVVTAALETLNVLLSNPSRGLKNALLHPGGITRSYIHSVRQSSRLWSRTASEISVAGSVTTGEESLLDDGDLPFPSLVIPEQTSYTINRLRSLSASAEDDVDSDPESVISELGPPVSLISRQGTNEEDFQNEQDELMSITPSEFEKEMDVGSFTDASLSLLFCSRRLAAFLLDGTPGGLRSDRSSRVSVKSIAVSCLSGVINLCPRLLSVKLTPFSDCEQRISDVLLLSQHSDPQLRGVVCVLIGTFLNSCLMESRGRTVPSLDEFSKPMSIQNLLEILHKSLRDSSPATSRLALTATQIFLNSLIYSDYYDHAITLVSLLPETAKNAYWLNKVRLIDLLSSLDYVVITEIAGNNDIQTMVLENVLFPMLRDIDGRVRRAAAEGIINVVDKLCMKHSGYIAYSERFGKNLTESLKSGKKRFVHLHLSLPFSHLQRSVADNVIEPALSHIVAKLTHFLMIYADKYQLYGILEALGLLSEKYPPILYPSCWQCNRQANTGISCLLPFLVALASSNSDVIDLACLENITQLIANLYAGNAICAMKTNNFEISSYVPNARWLIFGNDEMGKITEEFLTHILTVLNIYTQLQETPASTKPHGRILHLLPTKKGDREEISFRVQPHYLKLHQTLRHGHLNYKMCIDDNASEKFLGVLSKTLLGLSAILEICLPTDSARIAEEALSYMRILTPLQQGPTLTVTLQLFRSLFGVNLPHYWTGLGDIAPNCVDSLYANIFQAPEELMSGRSRKTTKGKLGKNEIKKLLCLNPDKMELVSYLKLLEHMIIKALRIYTKTSDTEFQCIVLTLLTQMVEENVKYNHLDEQLVFIGFVKKQLELIERGHIIVDEILSKIFKFFVCLSSEKQNAKPLMTIPDILQLFVGLMASDLPHETHCVLGFMPVVVEVFTPRSQLGDERKETETQREVLLANLLRLAKHREILHAISYAVECDPQVSGKVASALLGLLTDGRIKLEDPSCRKALSELFSNFSVSVFHPADCLLTTIFSEPRDQGEWYEMVRWLAAETILLESLFQLKEDTILVRVQALVHPVDLSAFLSPPSTRPDPLMVSPPSLSFPPAESLARLILLSISRSAVVLLNNPVEADQLEITLNGYFVVIFHFLQSGNFRQTASELQNLIKTDHSTISSVTDLFMQLSPKCPLLTSQYLNFIGLLLCVDPRIWTPPLTTTSSFASKILQKGAILALADYLCENTWDVETMDLLFTATSQVLELYDEDPVKEVLTHGAQQLTSGPTILKAINSLNLTTAKSTERALRVIRVIHSDYSGNVVRLVVTKFLKLPYFALSRMASGHACRRLEYLLLQPQEEVLNQLPYEAFHEIRSTVDETSAKHPTLCNLVSKIGKQFYGLVDETKTSQKLIQVSEVNEEWFFNQVKQRCCQRLSSYRETGPLLIKLGYSNLKNLFSIADFQILVLGDCFLAVESCIQDSNGRVGLDDVPAYRAAREAIIERIGCSVFCEESDPIWDMARILTIFLDGSPKNLSHEEMSAIVEFSMHCLHKIAEGLEKIPSPSPSIVEAALSCVRALFNHRDAQFWLNRSEHLPILEAALRDCVSVVSALNAETSKTGVEFLMEFLLRPCSLPKYLEGILKRVVVLLCRLQPFWGAAVCVPEAGDVDPEVLNLLKDKIKILGWTSRAQFEEVWAAFLGGFSQDFGDASTTSLAGMSALEGISILMEETLLAKCGDPGSLLIGHSRDFSLLREYAHGAPRLNSDDGFFNDLEAVLQPKGNYRVGLYSVEHLWSATQLAAASPDAVASDSTTRQQIADIGLDLTSCLHFLLELYSQWTVEIQDQQFLATALKTSLILSDQFTDPSQFRSLLNIVSTIDKSFQPSQLPLLPFCILIAAKCQAALLPGVHDYDKLKLMMTRSDAPSAKLATIQGVLFLVQSPVVYWKLQPTRQLGNSMFYVEDNEAVTQLVDTFIPYAIELLLQFSVDRCTWSETYEIHSWTLLVYLLLHYRRELQDNRDEFIELLLSTLAAHKGSHATQTVILHGIERLMLAGSLDEEHILKLEATANLLIGQPEPSARRNGYQILLTSSFINKRCINPLVLDPDSLMAAMERLGLLLGRLRRAVPSEAAHAAHALRYLLRDLQPLDVLTKLIQEFLSSHHPYTNILASLLFQVMEDADFELLQHWVVFSLPSLIHNVPFMTSSRTLTCLFLSACRDPWLRAAFPLTQTRHRGKETQFPQLLIEAAAHFYSQLEDVNRQKIFRDVFETASKTSPIYAEILNVITSK